MLKAEPEHGFAVVLAVLCVRETIAAMMMTAGIRKIPPATRSFFGAGILGVVDILLFESGG